MLVADGGRGEGVKDAAAKRRRLKNHEDHQVTKYAIDAGPRTPAQRPAASRRRGRRGPERVPASLGHRCLTIATPGGTAEIRSTIRLLIG